LEDNLYFQKHLKKRLELPITLGPPKYPEVNAIIQEGSVRNSLNPTERIKNTSPASPSPKSPAGPCSFGIVEAERESNKNRTPQGS
jgi:hypothetical protein